MPLVNGFKHSVAWQARVIAALRGERAGDISIDGQIASMDDCKGPARMICAVHVVIPTGSLFRRQGALKIFGSR